MGEEGFAGGLPMECRGVWGWSPHQCGAALTAGKQHRQHQQDLHLPFAPLRGETEGGETVRQRVLLTGTVLQTLSL